MDFNTDRTEPARLSHIELRPESYNYHPSSLERMQAQEKIVQKTKEILAIDDEISAHQRGFQDLAGTMELANMNQIHLLSARRGRSQPKHRQALELLTLQGKRKDIETELRGVQAIIAPIKKLPVEVLAEIFLVSVEGSGELMQIKLVCKAWEITTIYTPRLWKNILLSPRGKSAFERSRPILFPKKCKNMSQFQYVMDRAAKTQLDLEVDEVFFTEEPDIIGSVRRILPQCRLLAIKCEGGVPKLLSNHEIPTHLPYLMELCIKGSDSIDSTWMKVLNTGAPRLEHLVLELAAVEPWSKQPFFHERLTHLLISRACGSPNLEIFSPCTSLRSLLISRTGFSQVSSQSKIILPSLEELTLEIVTPTDVLPFLDAPKLSSLTISGDEFENDGEWPSYELQFPALTTLEINEDPRPLFLFGYHKLESLSIQFSHWRFLSSSKDTFGLSIEALKNGMLHPTALRLGMDEYESSALRLLKTMDCVEKLELIFSGHPKKNFIDSLGGKPEGKGKPFRHCPKLKTLEVFIVQCVDPEVCSTLFTPYLEARASGGFPIEKFSCKCGVEKPRNWYDYS